MQKPCWRNPKLIIQKAVLWIFFLAIVAIGLILACVAAFFCFSTEYIFSGEPEVVPAIFAFIAIAALFLAYLQYRAWQWIGKRIGGAR